MSTTTSPTNSAAGSMAPLNCDNTSPVPLSIGDTTGVARADDDARLSSATNAPGTTPITTLGTTNQPMATFIEVDTSRASAAPEDLGWPKKPMPNTFTNATAV